jgi:hypothetical protein
MPLPFFPVDRGLIITSLREEMSRSPSNSSRSSSRSSNRSSSRSPDKKGEEISPSRSEAAGAIVTTPSVADRSASSAAGSRETVDEASLLIHFALRGDVLALRRILSQAAAAGRSAGLLAHVYSRKSKKGETVKGTLLFFAAYCGHESIVRTIAEIDPHGLRANAWPAFSALASKWNFDGALLLLPAVVDVVGTSTSASFPLTVSRSSGDNFLHRALRLKKPPTAFVKAVLTAKRRLRLDVNERNSEGLTALHLVAMFGYGAEGRDAAKLLLAAGADELMTTPAGATAKELAANGYVREVLGMAAPGKPRHVPEIDPAVKEAIDECADSSHFPPLPEVKEPLPEPNASAAPANDETGDGDDGGEGSKRRELNLTSKVINQEDVDAMLGRLYDQSIAKRKNDYSSALDKLAEEDKARYHSKVLSPEEVEASVQRLYQQEMEGRLERATSMMDKYMPPRDPPKKLDMSEMEESNQRLCRGSMEYLAQTRRTLTAKYSPPPEHRKMTKEEVAQCAQRLHDQCTEASRKEMEELFEHYAVIKKGRFNGERKMTNEEIKAMGDRLCKAK